MLTGVGLGWSGCVYSPSMGYDRGGAGEIAGVAIIGDRWAIYDINMTRQRTGITNVCLPSQHREYRFIAAIGNRIFARFPRARMRFFAHSAMHCLVFARVARGARGRHLALHHALQRITHAARTCTSHTTRLYLAPPHVHAAATRVLRNGLNRACSPAARICRIIGWTDAYQRPTRCARRVRRLCGGRLHRFCVSRGYRVSVNNDNVGGFLAAAWQIFAWFGSLLLPYRSPNRDHEQQWRGGLQRITLRALLSPLADGYPFFAVHRAAAALRTPAVLRIFSALFLRCCRISSAIANAAPAPA